MCFCFVQFLRSVRALSSAVNSPTQKSMISSGKNLLVRLSMSGAQLLSFIIAHSCSSAETRPNARLFAHLGRRLLRQACSPLIQFFLGFASDINQTNINRDIGDGNWLSTCATRPMNWQHYLRLSSSF